MSGRRGVRQRARAAADPFGTDRAVELSFLLLLTPLLLACCDNRSATTSTSSSTPPSTAITPTVAPVPVVTVPLAPTTSEGVAVLDDGCGAVPPATYVETGTMHTVVMSEAPITARVAPEPGTICPGGQTELSVTFEHTGSTAVTIGTAQVILSAGIDKWSLGAIADAALEPGSTVVRTLVVTVPLVPPGDYDLFVRGFAPGGVISVNESSGS